MLQVMNQSVSFLESWFTMDATVEKQELTAFHLWSLFLLRDFAFSDGHPRLQRQNLVLNP